ncbi:MAG: type II toxin-antitoxin system VapC family toxin [Candidatus Bathyarchaeia archaeon]|jgi:predicted nucleic acid-binding protein
MEPNRTIIDTDILTDFLRNKKEDVTFITQLEEKKTLLSTTAINAFELYYGAYKSRQSIQTLQATKKLLERLVLLPLTPRSAQRAGHIYAELELDGHSIGLRDTFIAAIALTRSCSVATRNIEHFKKVKGLTVITT